MTLTELTDRLEPGRRLGRYVCPVHGDDGYELCVTPGDRQPVLLYCQGGCDSADVLKAVGLTWHDLR